MATITATGSDTGNPTLFAIGAKVTCGTDPCGKITRVIIDPIQRTVTHIVVEPRKEERGRLVPLSMVESSTPERVELSCTPDEFHELEPSLDTYDAIPPGEVTIRRGDPVHATDGDIGRIAGLVIGTPTAEVTHVLLQEGHLWGKRDVSIPIRSVTRVGGVVEVNLSKHELEQLPTVDIDHPEAAGANLKAS